MARIVTRRKVSKTVRELPPRITAEGKVVARRLVTKKTSYSRRIEK